MVRPFPVNHVVQNCYSLPLAMAMFVSISVVIALCSRHSKQYYLRKYCRKTRRPTHDHSLTAPSSTSLMLLPEKVIASSGDDKAGYKDSGEGSDEGGVWQKSILMGERCQPPQFSGVVFYDSYGNRISELPRSPRVLNHVQKYSFLQDGE